MLVQGWQLGQIGGQLAVGGKHVAARHAFGRATLRLRVAVCAMDLLRRTTLSRVVAEAGHIVVGADDAADVVLADGDCAPA